MVLVASARIDDIPLRKIPIVPDLEMREEFESGKPVFPSNFNILHC